MRLDPGSCRSRFGAARHAYLATVGDDGAPHLVPVTFALVSDSRAGEHRDEVVSAVDHKPKATQDLRRLRDIAADPRVTLLADRYDDDWARLWWVRADGVATVEREGEPRAAALDALAARYPQYRDHRPDGPLIRVEVTRWSGWAHG